MIMMVVSAFFFKNERVDFEKRYLFDFQPIQQMK